LEQGTGHLNVFLETRPELEKCTETDKYNALIYEHAVIGQAVAAAVPQGMIFPEQILFAG